MAKEIRNLGASVRARLLQLAKASGQSFDLVLTRFALERLLFRISQSPTHALTGAFAKDEEKQRQWNAFVESVAHEPGNLTDVIAEIATFLMPHAVAAGRLGK